MSPIKLHKYSKFNRIALAILMIVLPGGVILGSIFIALGFLKRKREQKDQEK